LRPRTIKRREMSQSDYYTRKVVFTKPRLKEIKLLEISCIRRLSQMSAAKGLALCPQQAQDRISHAPLHQYPYTPQLHPPSARHHNRIYNHQRPRSLNLGSWYLLESFIFVSSSGGLDDVRCCRLPNTEVKHRLLSRDEGRGSVDVKVSREVCQGERKWIFWVVRGYCTSFIQSFSRYPKSNLIASNSPL